MLDVNCLFVAYVSGTTFSGTALRDIADREFEKKKKTWTVQKSVVFNWVIAWMFLAEISVFPCCITYD